MKLLAIFGLLVFLSILQLLESRSAEHVINFHGFLLCPIILAREWCYDLKIFQEVDGSLIPLVKSKQICTLNHADEHFFKAIEYGDVRFNLKYKVQVRVKHDCNFEGNFLTTNLDLNAFEIRGNKSSSLYYKIYLDNKSQDLDMKAHVLYDYNNTVKKDAEE